MEGLGDPGLPSAARSMSYVLWQDTKLSQCSFLPSRMSTGELNAGKNTRDGIAWHACWDESRNNTAHSRYAIETRYKCRLYAADFETLRHHVPV